MLAARLRREPRSHEFDGLARPNKTSTSDLRSHNDACAFARGSSQRKKAANPAQGTLDAIAFSVAIRYLASQRPTLLGNPSGRQKLSVPDFPALCAKSNRRDEREAPIIHLETDLDREGGCRAQRKGGIGL